MESINSEEDALYVEVGNFYLNNDKLHDVQFIVGEQKENIKAVKLPLINQSRTWWSMLSEDSPLVEKGNIYLPNIDPEVFKLLLKHSYGGLEKLVDLSDDMVVKLCYCANKYFMKSLMTKIADRLEPKDVDSVFPALHCLVYYNLHGVEDGVKKIVQTRTKKISEHPEFLECDVDSITYICKQHTLNCDELTLWKAVVSWAKHKAQGGEGNQLRQWMSQPLQHIRLLTLSELELFYHVFNLFILSGEEVSNICLSKASHKIVSPSTSLCYDISPRLYFVKECNVVSSVEIRQDGYNGNINFVFQKVSCSCLLVKSKKIDLQAISIRGFTSDSTLKDYRGRLYQNEYTVDVGIKITRITDLTKNMSDEKPVLLNVNGFKHFCFDRVTIPTIINNKGITLEANSKYEIELSFSLDMPCYVGSRCIDGHDFDHGTFYCCLAYSNGIGFTPCHIIQFTYSFGIADD